MKVSIVGVLGYTGEELLKLLTKHPEVKEIEAFDKEEINLAEIYPQLKLNISSQRIDAQKIRDSNVIFLATPSGVAMRIMNEIISNNSTIIDLSADFRLKDKNLYKTYYQLEHTCPELLGKFAYGLTELNREKIKQSKLISNPGCYPTSVILPCAPILKSGIVEGTIIVDSKSGYSGAGREFSKKFKSNPNTYPYSVGTMHRHVPEMRQELSCYLNSKVNLIFSPHILTQERGIISTIYLKLKDTYISSGNVFNIFMKQYENEPFIRILPEGELPKLKDVLFTNRCDIGFVIERSVGYLILISAIDNLLKGASGQAVQNMNLKLSIDETTALPS